MAQYTHQIISITAAKTKYGTPMWRCATLDGSSVNIFPEGNGHSARCISLAVISQK